MYKRFIVFINKLLSYDYAEWLYWDHYLCTEVDENGYAACKHYPDRKAINK
jgi:hypothetical protein